jgi:hypothetical protein
MIDLTGIAVSIIAGVFSILAVIVPIYISSKLKDKQAVDTLNRAVENSLGAIQQAIEKGLVPATGVSPHLTIGVDYVRSHAGAAADRLGITQAMIGDKISSQIGLKHIETNIATASSAQATPLPLASLITPASTPSAISPVILIKTVP